MTDQQIIEFYEANNSLSVSQKSEVAALCAMDVEKLIDGMKRDLFLMAGTTDADNLAALMDEKWLCLTVNDLRLFQLRITMFGTSRDPEIPDVGLLHSGVGVMAVLTEMAKRRPDYKAKLIDAVAEQAPIIISELDKFAPALIRKAPEPRAR